ncbi:MAG TPA: transglycosylase domain-containing protein [Acidimicrobiales bacterium]|nr:transglycosylase domain-containing protein [Acidimicrobiales bacterium]
MPGVRWITKLLAAVAVATGMLATSLGLTALGAGALRSSVRAESMADIELAPLARRSQILAADGAVLSNLYEEDRIPVPLADVPPVFRAAVLAVEDSAFYEHEGLSIRGVLRALKANLTNGDVEQGGSTITQQLVKNTMLTSERSYDRKAKEALLAIRVEHEMPKNQILEQYLNTVYFGHGAHGVQAAVERYFDKGLAEVTLPEAALLAGLISSPQGYDPIKRPEAATARRAHVLDRMAGLDFVTVEEAEAAKTAPLPTTITTRQAQPDDYFTEEVRRQLQADPRLGATAEERSNTLLRGGVTVHTTLDPALQALAEQAVREKLPASPYTASLVAVDPTTGAVKALVGGPNFEQAKFNLATQGARQTGSSFKTIALAAWLAAGRSPEDLVEATAPCTFPMPPPEVPWTVDNYDGGSGQPTVTSVRDATIRSYNCAYARVALALGPAALVDMAHRLGASRPIPAVPSVVLGTGEVSPLEMASIYATLAAEGVRRPPLFITKVTGPDGRVLLENAPAAEQVLDPQVARTVTQVLQGVIERGTGRRAAIGRPAAGKTGTAQEWRDAWFAGYTPQLAAAVWMGSPLGQESMADVNGRPVTGGSYPAEIWSAFMGPAMAGLPVAGFAPPDAAAWPVNDWVGGPPAVLPPGLVLPPHLAPPPPPPVVAPAPAPVPPVGSIVTSPTVPPPGHRKKGSG